jgi:hypothetical protein
MVTGFSILEDIMNRQAHDMPLTRCARICQAAHSHCRKSISDPNEFHSVGLNCGQVASMHVDDDSSGAFRSRKLGAFVVVIRSAWTSIYVQML